MSTLYETFLAIGEMLEINAQDLIAFANEDTIGGYHSDPMKARWPIGSVWEVDGKILYAIVRALKPAQCLELGTYHGCSATHIASALKQNGHGTLLCIDNDLGPAAFLQTKFPDIVKLLNFDLDHYQPQATPTFDFVFEDGMHTADMVEKLYRRVLPAIKAGSVVISHDAGHFLVGGDVREGIGRVVQGAKVFETTPSDCGVSIYRKPQVTIPDRMKASTWDIEPPVRHAQEFINTSEEKAIEIFGAPLNALSRAELEAALEARGFEVSDVTRADGKDARPRNSDIVAFLEELNSL